MTRNDKKAELIYKDESYAIIGACFAVYKDKGCGFLEPIFISKIFASFVCFVGKQMFNGLLFH